MLAGTIEFGRLMFDANALQDVARVAARELALAPLRANVRSITHSRAIRRWIAANCLVDLRARVFDPPCLVVDLNDPARRVRSRTATSPQCPVVNRALRTLMITEPRAPNNPALRRCADGG
jgi:hypothetical protein